MSWQRWISQELLHLACMEPGDNQIDVHYDGIGFDIPVGWISEVPKRGLLQLFYCRNINVMSHH
jgi:hypothetical protein